jgi:hypothetical protein
LNVNYTIANEVYTGLVIIENDWMVQSDLVKYIDYIGNDFECTYRYDDTNIVDLNNTDYRKKYIILFSIAGGIIPVIVALAIPMVISGLYVGHNIFCQHKPNEQCDVED